MGEPTREKSNLGHRVGRVEVVKAKLKVAKDLLSHRERFLLSVEKSVARARREVQGLESRLGYEEAKLADIKRQAMHLYRKRAAAADRKREADRQAAVRLKAVTPEV